MPRKWKPIGNIHKRIERESNSKLKCLLTAFMAYRMCIQIEPLTIYSGKKHNKGTLITTDDELIKYYEEHIIKWAEKRLSDKLEKAQEFIKKRLGEKESKS